MQISIHGKQMDLGDTLKAHIEDPLWLMRKIQTLMPPLMAQQKK